MKHGTLCWCGLLALLGTVGGCGSPDSRGATAWAGSVDTVSTGHVVVHNPDAPLVPESWRLEERSRIGTLDGQGPDLFGHIGGLELGSEGQVYVLEDQANEVRVFDSGAAFLRRFGRDGEGPGELSSPGGLTLDPAGTLWVLNWGNGRYTGFNPSTGELEKEVRREVSFASFPWPGSFDARGRLIDVGLNRDGEMALLRLDGALAPTDTFTLPEPEPEDRIMFRRGTVVVASMMEPFAPQPAWAPRPRGGIVLGEGSAYRWHRIDFDGDTSMTVELDRAPVRVSDAERDSALAAFAEMQRSLGDVVPQRRPRAHETRPAHGILLVDDLDRTWIQAGPSGGGQLVWDVFGADGRYLAQVPFPEGTGFIRPVVRDGRMVIATQARGFPEVVVYDLVQAQNGGEREPPD